MFLKYQKFIQLVFINANLNHPSSFRSFTFDSSINCLDGHNVINVYFWQIFLYVVYLSNKSSPNFLEMIYWMIYHMQENLSGIGHFHPLNQLFSWAWPWSRQSCYKFFFIFFTPSLRQNTISEKLMTLFENTFIIFISIQFKSISRQSLCWVSNTCIIGWHHEHWSLSQIFQCLTTLDDLKQEETLHLLLSWSKAMWYRSAFSSTQGWKWQ